MHFFIKIQLILFSIISFSFEQCFLHCKNCLETSYDIDDMKCIDCIDDYYFKYNTTNCEHPYQNKNYYLNKTNKIMYPCSLFMNSNCYECDPYSKSEDRGICISCKQGYRYNKETKECIKYKDSEYSIIISDFDNCEGIFYYGYCDKYITYCMPITNEIICPDYAPIFNNLTKSCQENECPEEGFKNGTCLTQNEKYKNRILFTNWFNNNPKIVKYPSYNTDNSGNLLIELTCELPKSSNEYNILKNKKRKLYFYNVEGRGTFNEINDEYEKDIELNKNSIRYLSTSIALKPNNSDEYSYLLNFESHNYNFELFNIKTGESSEDYLFDVFQINGFNNGKASKIPRVLLLELKQNNLYLVVHYVEEVFKYQNYILLHIIYLSQIPGKKIDINSIKNFQTFFFKDELINDQSYISCIQTKNEYILMSYIIRNNTLKITVLDPLFKIEYSNFIDTIFTFAFHKLIYLKEEKSLLSYYSENSIKYGQIKIKIYNYMDKTLKPLLVHDINVGIDLGRDCDKTDIIKMTDNKVIILFQKFNRRKIIIYVFDFFDDYTNFILSIFEIMINQKLSNNIKFPLLFKYKDLLGFQYNNVEDENGFILFGYFNSTDPKQIYNIKKECLNYNISLSQYLFLQSNIFGYEIKNIRIIEAPNADETGLYLISNKTNNIIKNRDYVDLDTKISLYFSYNGTLKQGNYLFKFVGIVEEPTFENTEYYSDKTSWSMEPNEISDEYKKIYNERRNMNITGRVALVQINVLNDTRVFCDKKYDDTALKTKENKYLTCGNGKFFEVENENEITQLYLGINYFFDYNKNKYIKCHPR